MLTIERDIIIKDWNDLQDRIFLHSYDPSINRFRSPYVFRGLHDKSFELKSSLIRLENDPLEMEKHLFRNFKKYAPTCTIKDDSDWLWLTIAQLHGLPTRLIDWTFSPYIALHFMCDNIKQFDVDGVLWCVDFHQTKELLPKLFKQALDLEKAKAFDIEILKSVCPTINELNNFLQDEEFAVFFEPPSIDERIINQYSLFSFMSNPTTVMDEWLKKHKELYFRLIIPSNLKHEIRDKLDQLNITERMLFPGLDGLSSWLKRWYSKF